jgi:hypothetical protein
MSDMALRLAHAYNPRTFTLGETFPAVDRDRWLAAARATATLPDDREAAAAHLHAAYVRDIPVQREHGWPPLADSERDRWLAVADAARGGRS